MGNGQECLGQRIQAFPILALGRPDHHGFLDGQGKVNRRRMKSIVN